MEDQVLSIEQMQELIELGIDTSKASMCWIGCADGNDVYPYNSTFKDIFENHKETIPSVLTPTFTLQDILEILPLEIDVPHKKYPGRCYGRVIYPTFICYEYYDDFLHQEIISENSNSLLTEAFNMLKWCKQNNYI